MIAALGARLGLSFLTRSGWLFVAAFVAVASAAAAWGAWTICDWRWQAMRADALKQEIAAREAAEKRANEAASQYLAAKEQRRIVYREVIKHVPQYVDRGECRVTPDGMQQLACALDPAKCSAQPVAAGGTAAGTSRP